ncbi:MAG: hypothetical protein RML39_00975 [Oscillatoriaceae cyanobacterium SKYGB_i_bin93]|nr:hypothetical protein [Oscillatoriaceae cyanobacterium SKYGB_i_bin93]
MGGLVAGGLLARYGDRFFTVVSRIRPVLILCKRF